MNLHSSFSSQAQRIFYLREDDKLQTLGTQGGSSKLVNYPETVHIPGHLVSFACGSSHNLALTEDGRLYAWGSNRSRQLGLDLLEVQYLPTQVKLPTEEKIISVYSHGSASYALTERGRLWVWGENNDGQLGYSKSREGSTPKEGPRFPYPVVDVAPGFTHVMALTEDGSVWSWGSNGDGRLGVPNSDCESSQVPIQLTFFKNLNVSRIFAGSGTSLVLTKSGALYIWGWNNYGLLGKGPTNIFSTHEPHLIFPSGVQEVACGWSHNIVLLEDGSLWTWGNNSSHQSGFPISGFIHEPQQLELPDLEGKIRGLIAGDAFSAVVTEHGDFYVFGNLLTTIGKKSPNPTKFDVKVKVPQPHYEFFWQSWFKWLFLGKIDQDSFFYYFPMEVIFHFVQTRF
jgi:alpha-tubulin suppressor-like RCC1 family protein